MDIDVTLHLGAVTRTVVERERDGRPLKAVVATRTYETGAEDLWNALTDPERLPRWFLPVSGDLRLNGHYQLEGNAGGEITGCEPPRHLALTWRMGEGISWVEVTLVPEGPDRTRLTLEHSAFVDAHWDRFGPGAVGVGWELGLLGLALHIGDPGWVRPEGDSWDTSPQGQAFVTGSSAAWGEAAIAGGEDPGQARSAAANTTAFYTGQSLPDAGS